MKKMNKKGFNAELAIKILGWIIFLLIAGYMVVNFVLKKTVG